MWVSFSVWLELKEILNISNGIIFVMKRSESSNSPTIPKKTSTSIALKDYIDLCSDIANKLEQPNFKLESIKEEI
jgi:hypothetical protein